MGAIEEVFEDIDADVSLGEFREAVEKKVEQMAGLADEETAALLVAHELDENRILSIDELDPVQEEAKFLAKVRRVGEHRTFEREEDEDGHVVNVEAIDETGDVRLTFWDDHAQAIAAEGLEPGTVLKVQGRPTEGLHGLEVSVQHAEPTDETDIDVDIDASRAISDLSLGQSGVRVRGRVLDTDTIRTFERDDGSEGKVSNVIVGDATGRTRITLWDERAETVERLDAGDSVEIREGSVRERDGRLEVHVGDRGAVESIEEDIAFEPRTTPIRSLAPGDVVDVAGVVRSTNPKRTFDRDDGTEGQVRNIRVQDETGDVRVALWGDAADRDLAPGDTIWLGDVEVRDGWEDDVELSVGWQSSIAPVDLSAVTVEADSADTDESASLAAFDDSEQSEPEPGESVEFTGTVVQTGTPIIVDDGEEALRVETETDVILGQEVTVRGPRQGDHIDADEVRSVSDDG